ncbi:MAG: thioredoxin-dependent thiol peroxidase [Pseudomonadota bacterium]
MSHSSPETGAPAPGFTLPADGEKTVSLSDFAGKTVVLYFYPKDDTPGCTKEAIGFSEQLEAFEAAGAVVIGASKDPVKKHDKFVAKHGLKVTLVSDEESDLCERYGVWVEKNMYGKKYMGIERSTFLIDGDGVLRQAWRKVKVPGHVDAVLQAVTEL